MSNFRMRKTLGLAAAGLLVFGATGAMAQTTFEYTGPTVTIPDNSPGGVSVQIPVSAFLGNIGDIDVQFGEDNGGGGCTTQAFDAEQIADLVIDITSPEGTTVRLMENNFVTGAFNTPACGIYLDDEAATTLPVGSGIAPYAGNYQPVGSLADFDGENPNGTWTITLVDNNLGNTGSFYNASIIITADAGSAVVGVIDASVAEGNSGTSVSNDATIVISTQPASNVVVDYEVVDGTADSSDYSATNGQVTFTPTGATSFPVPITINGDTVPEMNETVQINITNVTGPADAGPNGVLQIINDDPMGHGTLLGVGGAVVAKARVADFGPTLGTNTIPTVIGGTGLNFANGAPAGATFVGTGGTRDYSTLYAIVYDNSAAADLQPAIARIDAVTGDILSITNITNPPTDQLYGMVHDVTTDTTYVLGDAGSPSFQGVYYPVDVSTATLGAQSVMTGANNDWLAGGFAADDNGVVYAIYFGPTAPTQGNAFLATLDLATGAFDTVGNTEIPIWFFFADMAYDPGTGLLYYSTTLDTNTDGNPDGYRLYSINPATAEATLVANLNDLGLGQIANIDIVPTDTSVLTVSVADNSVTEGDAGTSQVDVTISLSAPNPDATPVEVNWATADGTAEAGIDYVAASGTVSFAQNEETKVVSIDVLGDTDFECDETFTVSISVASGDAELATSVATITIIDDDPVPTVGNVAFGSNRTALTFDMFSLDNGASGDLFGFANPVDDFFNGGAFNGNNLNAFIGMNEGVTITTIDPDTGVQTAGATLSGRNDPDNDPAGTNFFPLDAGYAHELGAFYLLLEDFGAGRLATKVGTLDLGIGEYTNLALFEDAVYTGGATGGIGSFAIAPDGTAYGIAVTAGGASYSLVELDLTQDNTATVLGTLPITPGGWLSVMDIDPETGLIIFPVNRGVGSPNRADIYAINPSTLAVDFLGTSCGGAVRSFGVRKEFTGATPLLASISGSNVVEGNSGTTPMTFVVTLDRANDGLSDVILDWTTIDVVATAADNDYIPATGQVTIAVGETSQSLTVDIVGDTKFENDEEVGVQISVAAGSAPVQITTAVGLGLILNDDLTPVQPATAFSFQVSGGSALQRVDLTSGAAAPVLISPAPGGFYGAADYVGNDLTQIMTSSFTLPSELNLVNVSTGALTFAADIDNTALGIAGPVIPMDMAYNYQTDEMFLLMYNFAGGGSPDRGAISQVVAVDMTDPTQQRFVASYEMATLGYTRMTGLAISNTGDVVALVANGADDDLILVSLGVSDNTRAETLADDTVTEIGATGVGFDYGEWCMIDFDPTTAVLYAGVQDFFTAGQSTLYELDFNTGAATRVGDNNAFLDYAAFATQSVFNASVQDWQMME